MTSTEYDTPAELTDVRRAVCRMQYAWTALFALNAAFLALAATIQPRPEAIVDNRLPQLTSLLSGCGGLVAVAGIIVRAQLDRSAFESAISVRRYLLDRFRGMIIGIGMAQVWPILGLVLRARGASLAVAVVTTIGGGVGCLFHFPFTSDIQRNVEKIARRLANRAAGGRTNDLREQPPGAHRSSSREQPERANRR